jgi:predicted enzyme related to lactoylglutathione lyase
MAHGTYNHVEIPADDPARAQKFYEGLFGWSFTEMPGFDDYYLYLTAAGRDGVGGAIGKRDESAGHTIRNYILVDSLDDAVAKAESLGGRVVAAKQEVPTQGWFAVLNDTEGNEFALWQQIGAT